MLENLFADVRFALRWLRRSPAFTLVAIASLAIGIGFNTALFTLVDALLFRPLPVERPDRLVDVFTSGGDGDQYATSSYPDFLDFKAQNEVFTDMLAYSPAIAAVKLTDRSRLAMGETVTGNYFQLLGVHAGRRPHAAARGRRPGAPRVVVISYRLWNREFGRQRRRRSASRSASTASRTRSSASRRATFTGMVPLLAPEVWTPMALRRRGRAGRHHQHGAVADRQHAARAARHALDVRQGTAEAGRDATTPPRRTCASSASGCRPTTTRRTSDFDVSTRADQRRAHPSGRRSRAACRSASA